MKCVERLCKSISGTKCRHFVLGDNVALVLTQCRWRSRLFAFIVMLRRAAAYILARDMVTVSRWIMSEMNTSDAPSGLQERHQPQDQVMHATDEQAQSGAWLARASECGTSNETNHRALSRSKRNTVPPAWPYSTSGHRDDGCAGGKQALSEGSARNETMHVCLLKKRTCAEFKHRKPPATPQQRTKQKQSSTPTLSDEATRRRRLLVCRIANDAAANVMNLVQQEQDAPPISGQAQSEACLARACVNGAPNETYQSTRSVSKHSSERAALPYPADDSRYTDLTGYEHAITEADLDGQANDAGHGGTLETKPCTSLCVGKG